MIHWLSSRRQQRRIEEMRSVCEVAMIRLGYDVSVDVSRVTGSSLPEVRYLVMLNTAQQIRPEALLALRGYLGGELRDSLELRLAPENLMVFAMDVSLAGRFEDRVSRLDVLAKQLRGSEMGSPRSLNAGEQSLHRC